MQTTYLVNNKTDTGAGQTIERRDSAGKIKADGFAQAIVTGTGAVTATVDVQVSNGGTFLTMGTITLSGTGSDSDGFAFVNSSEQIRANVTAISGTGAKVTVTVS